MYLVIQPLEPTSKTFKHQTHFRELFRTLRVKKMLKNFQGLWRAVTLGCRKPSQTNNQSQGETCTLTLYSTGVGG